MIKTPIQISMLLALAGGCVAAQATEPAATTEGAAGLSVARDADTGALRAPTAAEAAKLQALSARKAAGRVAVAPLARSHVGGARSVRLTDEFATYSVAVRKAGGAVGTQCVDSQDRAEAMVSIAGPAVVADAKE